MTPDHDAMAFEFDLAAPPEKVWRALTIPALVERWLLPTGDDGRMVGRPAGLGTHVEAQLIEADPPRLLSWRWSETDTPDDLVTFTLAPNGEGGTLLRLLHTRQVAVLPQPANGNGMTMMLRAA
jgi:uncharacterized protein YndB with AHSA1/START domain